MMRRLSALLLAATLPAPASAFCGFFVSGADSGLYNDASQVVMMRKGDHTVLTMSNNYRGPTEDFAMVVPVPVVLQEENVKTLPANAFDKIDQLSAPRLVEYWEQDPCFVPQPVEKGMLMDGMDVESSSAPEDNDDGGFGVKVEAQFAVGEYQIVILSAKEANGLEGWLKANKYTIPDGAGDALAPYVRSGMKFFVAKVDIKKVKKDAEGTVVLSPLRFDYPSKELRLPVRLGLLNAKSKQDLIVYVLHPKSRFEAANYPNVFIPSNLEVDNDVRKGFGEFYRALFDATMDKAGNKAVVTEYSWQSNGCDPCPVPPLQPSDIFTLGGDVFGEQNSKARKADPSQPFFGPASSWVLTRMHTRYDKKTLSEDLVFAEAGPVVGGRGSAGISREMPGAVEKSSVNNFQGRYIIRHYWAGKVECDNPQWGRWGGPPSGGQKTIAAKRIATEKKVDVALTKVVRSALPQLAIPASRRRNAEARRCGCGRSRTQAAACGRPPSHAATCGRSRTQATACGRPRTYAAACGRSRTQATACARPPSHAAACGRSWTQATACGRPPSHATACGRSWTQATACGRPPSHATACGRSRTQATACGRPPSHATACGRPTT